MNKIFTLVLTVVSAFILFLTSCDGINKRSSDNNQSEPNSTEAQQTQQQQTYNNTDPVTEDLWSNEVSETQPSNDNEQPFYIYHNDNGEVWISHSQEEEDEYQMMKAREAHYRAMEEQQRREAELERQRNDFHNWEDEDVSKFYAEFQAYNDDDAEDKHYFYKKADDRYFYEISLGYDTYEVEIEEKIESKFYKVKGSNVFLEFRFEPYLYRWDEGVLDCSGNHGTFYKKPN